MARCVVRAALVLLLATRASAFVPCFRRSRITFLSATDNVENAWRHIKKPLLRIGVKGASASHGNSLRNLLDDHRAVKVKVNTLPYEGSLENAYGALRDLAVASGASEDIELIQFRPSDKMLMIGLPGTMEMIERNEYPPPAIEEE